MNCPKCGKNLPNQIVEDDRYCGHCEQERLNELAEENAATIAENRVIMAKHGNACDCYNCTRAYILILYAQGKEREADALLNA